MAPFIRSRFFRGSLAFFFIGTALFVACYGVSLLVEAFDEHGSPGGNVLMIGLGLFLLVLSPIVFIAGLINWRLAHSSPRDANN
jgi:hypothetical protein